MSMTANSLGLGRDLWPKKRKKAAAKVKKTKAKKAKR